MANRDILQIEIDYLREEKEELSNQLEETKEELTYYKNRCNLLKTIVKKFRVGIKSIIN